MTELNLSHQIGPLRSNHSHPAATTEQRFDFLGQQEDQYLATSVRDPYSQRNESDSNCHWSHQISFFLGSQRSEAAPITEQRFGLSGQQEELQNSSQQGQYLATSSVNPYSQRNDYESYWQCPIRISLSNHHSQAAAIIEQQFDFCGLQEESQNNSQGGQYWETSTRDPHSQRNDCEPNWPHQISFSQSNTCNQAAPTADQRFGHWGQHEESQNNSQEGQYLVTFVREPHSQSNNNEANWPQQISFQQSNQRGQTLLGTTSNRAGSLIPSQAAEVTEQPLGQSSETSARDLQNIGQFSEEDRQLLKEIQKNRKRGVQISQEEERRLQELLKKRKRMHDNNYRQKKKDILDEKDRIIQQMSQHIAAVEAAKRELQRQLEEKAKKEQLMESKMKEVYNEAERLRAEIRSLKNDYVSANERVQHFSSELAELDNHYSDEQPNVTLPETESTQAYCMEVDEIQNHQYDELEQRNGTGRNRRMSSTRERDTADEESNSKPNFLNRLFRGLKNLKNKYWTTS